MKAWCIAVAVVLCAAASWAQAPDTLWTRTFGGADYEWANWIEPAHDSGWIIAAYTHSFGEGNNDIYLIKLNPDGSTAWSYTYGGDWDDVANDIKKTRDGGYIVFGYSSSYGPGSFYHLMKIDANGGFLWQHEYGADTSSNYGFGVCQMADGGFLMVGDVYTHTVYGYDWDLYVVKADEAGNLLNSYQVVWPGSQGGYRVIPTADSGAIMVNGRGMLFFKFNAAGDTVWHRGYSAVAVGNSILQLSDGGYMAFGYRDMGYNIEDQFWLLRLNHTGDTLWTRYYGGIDPDLGYCMQRTWDGGYIMVGEMYPEGEMQDIQIIRTDANGNMLWSKHVGNQYADYAYSVQCTPDRGYVIVGRTQTLGSDYDIYLVRLGPDTLISSVADDPGNAAPTEFSLGRNYPNPFNSTTSIPLILTRESDVRLSIYNIQGQRTAVVADGVYLAGEHRFVWDGKSSGADAPSGIYFYRAECRTSHQIGKMLLLR